MLLENTAPYDVPKTLLNEDQSNKGTEKTITISTSIREHVEDHGIDKAYDEQGEGGRREFFWGKNLKEGDYIEIVLFPPRKLSSLAIPSGDPEHVDDSMMDSSLSVSTTPYQGICDNYKVVKTFRDTPIVRHTFDGEEKVSCVRLTLTRIRPTDDGGFYWLVVAGISIK